MKSSSWNLGKWHSGVVASQHVTVIRTSWERHRRGRLTRTSWERDRALLWIEQAGKGAAENWAYRGCDSERAPAEIDLHQLKIFKWRLSGGTLGINIATRPISA